MAQDPPDSSSPAPPQDAIRSLKALAQIERDTRNPKAALPLYEQAVVLCRRIDDVPLLAHTIRHLGDVHLDLENLLDAEACYVEALTLYRASPRASRLDLANAIRPMAILKGRIGDADAARHLWEEARDLYRSLGIEAGVAECSANLADMR